LYIFNAERDRYQHRTNGRCGLQAYVKIIMQTV